MLWLSIYLPLLPLEVFQLTSPTKSNRSSIKNSAIDTDIPFAVTQSDNGANKHYIRLANKAARKKGIETYMSDSTALALCHDIELKNREINKEIDLLHNLAETAYQFSSQVIVYTNLQQEHSLLLEISGSLRLFGGLEPLKKAISESFYNHPLAQKNNKEYQGFCIQLAQAKTTRLSEVLARHRHTIFQQEKSHSLSDHKNKINRKINAEDIPIESLDCHHSDIKHCIDMGISALGELIDLPRDALGRRFPKRFIQYLNCLEGRQADPLPLFKPNVFFNQSIFFTYGLRSHNDLQHPMERLLIALTDYLRYRQLQCASLSWIFLRSSKKKDRITIDFSRPQIDRQEMLMLSQLQLDQLTMDSPVESICLHSKAFIPLQQQTVHINKDLFGNQTHTEANAKTTKISHSKVSNMPSPTGDIYLLQDKIQLKLGKSSIKLIRRKNHHLPEQANIPSSVNNYFSSSGRRKKPKDKQKKIEQFDFSNNILPNPKWLINPPEPISIEKLKNTYTLNQKQRIEILRGPERVQNNWWQKQHARDYFIIGCISSKEKSNDHYEKIYWVYKDRGSKQWFLQGVF